MKLSDEKGLTLIDTMVLLTVMGLFTAGVLNERHNKMAAGKSDKTWGNQGKIEKAINNYYLTRGEYPCPADPTLTTGESNADRNFGEEDCDNTNGDGINTGMVPFITLGLPREYTVNADNVRFIYALKNASDITVNKYQRNGWNERESFIESITADFDDIITNVDYIIVSSGNDVAGYYTNDGVLSEGCPDPDLATSPRDAENCDGDRVFIDSQEDIKSLSQDALDDNGRRMYYDDMVAYRIEAPTTTWDPDVKGNIVSSYEYVGVGDSPPEYALDIQGAIQIDNGDINVSNFCANEEGDEITCMDISKITTTGMICDNDNNFATTIAGNDVNCDNGFLSSIVKEKFINENMCPDGQYVVGINGSGKVRCKDPND